MRTLPKLGKEIVEQIEAAWRLPQEDWARKRLLVVRLISQHEHTVAEIMKIASVCRQTVFTYRDKVVAGGVQALLQRDWAGARRPTVPPTSSWSSLAKGNSAKPATPRHGSKSAPGRAIPRRCMW